MIYVDDYEIKPLEWLRISLPIGQRWVIDPKSACFSVLEKTTMLTHTAVKILRSILCDAYIFLCFAYRDSYVRKLQRQEEMRRVRDEIERQQEEEYLRKEQEQGEIGKWNDYL